MQETMHMEPDTPLNPAPLSPARAKPRFWNTRAFQTLVSFGSVLSVIIVCLVLYSRITTYGKSVVEAHPVDARIEIANAPAYLDRAIINTLLDEAYQYAQKDETTYNRARNTLDAGILREFAGLYTAADGQTQNRQAIGYNAWIKRIIQVRRDVAADKSIQAIEIFAEWRQPFAWVRVNDALYLIDADATRLPGDYHLEDRGRSKLLVLTGVDLPMIAGQPAVPEPGQRWTSGKDGTLGADLAAGMQLAALLRRQQFAPQIDAIDMANQDGRRDPLAPWIVLDTVWRTAGGAPRVVQWGRPIGEERFYEVQSEAKIKTLNEINLRFSRIDAGRDYVDIRTEVVRLPKLAMGG
jgi:hypothetical protein